MSDLTITPKTTVHTLLKEYPFLLEYLAGYHPEFGKLTNPVLRRTMGRMATLDKAAQLANVPLNQLMNDLAGEIAAKTGVRPEIADMPGVDTVDPARLAELAAIVAELHAGKTAEEVKPRFEELIADVEATEIAAMEQQLIEGGVPADDVKRLCDVHVQVFADALEGHAAVSAPPGHPLDTFQRENQALLQVTASLRKVAEAIGEPPAPDAWGRLKSALAGTVDRVAEVNAHYLRKENQLFPYLEAHGVEGPSKVMWAIHDDVRALIKQAARDHRRRQRRSRGEHLPGARQDGRRHGEQRREGAPPHGHRHPERRGVGGDPRRRRRDRLRLHQRGAGVAGGGPGGGHGGGAEAGAAGAPAGPATPAGLLALTTGGLDLEQLNLMLTLLPIDVQFVDEHDQVLFYSEGERIFPRSPGVIGRKVQNCHPPASVHKVQQIIDAFRAGDKSTAEFWIELGGKFLHIRYFAVRDASGAYRGVVEMAQDVTGIRALEGQRRLLDW